MSDTVTRTLVLLRHAKAGTHAAPDHGRPLAPRGHQDAAAVGRWLVAAGHRFDLVVCSTATRTRETWADVAAAGVAATSVAYEDRVYEAATSDLLEVLAGLQDDVRSVLVVGHAPGVPALAARLADPGQSPAALVQQLDAGFPTSGLAVLRVAADWGDLAPHAAELVAVAAPRG